MDGPEGNKQKAMLAGQAKNWPTPDASEGGARSENNIFYPNLKLATQEWPTPKGSPSGPDYARPGREGTGGNDFVTSVAQWPTPTSRIHKGGGKKTFRKDGKSRMDMLDWNAESFPTTPHQETTTELGLLLQVWTPPECPRLNPRFAEWLMGWPVGLTSFELSETEWIGSLQRMRSCLFGLLSNTVCEEVE